MSLAAAIDESIQDVCPIYGVSVGLDEDKATWRIHFKPEATDVQRASAWAVVDSFDAREIKMATIKNAQWVYSKLVPAGTDAAIGGADSALTWRSLPFPYTVPDGHWLAITEMSVDFKLIDQSTGYFRSSYFYISNVKALPTSVGHATFKTPLVIPEKTVLNAGFINNALEAQWMNGQVTGLLVPHALANTWQDVWLVIR